MQFFRYSLYPSQLYMFRMLRPSILRSSYVQAGRYSIYAHVVCRSGSSSKLQKRVIQSMCGAGTGTSCRQLFKDYKILMVTSLYVFEVLCFLKMYKSAIQKKKKVYDNTGTNMELHIKPCTINLYKKCN